jgi:hypothetical protein
VIEHHHSDDKKTLERTAYYPYPPDVAEKMSKAAFGLDYVYTPEMLLPSVIRTKHTPYSDAKWRDVRGLRQPIFVPEEGQGRFCLYREEEIEWLQAFLESCKFISGMSDVRWSPTETVAQMWERKSSL